MFDPPVKLLPPSTELSPISDEQRIDYIAAIDHVLSSDIYQSRRPSAIRLVGRLLNRLGDYEVACTYFSLAIAIETKDSKDIFLNSTVGNDAIVVRPTEDQGETSFCLSSNEEVIDALLLELAQRVGIPASRRDEFRAEFQQLAARHRALPAPKNAKKKRKPVSWQQMTLPPGLKWPAAKFAAAKKAAEKNGDTLSIIDHLRTAWRPLIEAGIATWHVVESVDETTVWGIKNYNTKWREQRRRDGDSCKLAPIPDDLLPLTKSQSIDLAIAADPSLLQTNVRTIRTVASRLAKAAAISPNPT